MLKNKSLPKLATVLVMLISAPAAADIVRVTNSSDLPPSAAACNFGPTTSTTCTLRKAIALTNSTSELDYIQFDVKSVTLTRVGSGDSRGDLDVRRDTIFKGPVVIQQQANSRVMQIFSNTSVTMAEITLRGGDTNGSGGGILHAGTQLTLAKSAIEQCAANRGGGIYAISPTHIIDSQISGNEASTAGGGVYARSTSFTATNSSFATNRANTLGGGILATSSAVVISDSSLQNNTVGQRGGGLYTRSSSLSLSNTDFSENNSNEDGGGIWIDSYSTAETVLTDLDIIGNTADGNGGGMYISGATTDITGINAEKNEAGETGGAAYFFRTTINSERSLWQNNSAQAGGAVAVLGQGNASFDSDSFTGNSAVAQSTGVPGQGTGGALAAIRDPLMTGSSSPNLMITQSDFLNNTATHSGGAIAGAFNGNITIESTRLSSNSSDFYAGTISAVDYLEMTDSVVEDSYSAAGVGAVNVFARAAKFRNVSFLDNVGSNSSALHLSPGSDYSTDFEIDSCYFDSNRARPNTVATALVVMGDTTITDSFFSNDDGVSASAQIEVKAHTNSAIPAPLVWLNRVSINTDDHLAVRTRGGSVGIKHSSLSRSGSGDIIDQDGVLLILNSTISASGSAAGVQPWKLAAPQLMLVTGSIINGTCNSANAGNSLGHNAWLKGSECLQGGGTATDVPVDPGMLDLGPLTTGGNQIGASTELAFRLGRPRGPSTPLEDTVTNCTGRDLWGVQRPSKCDAGALEKF